MLLLLFSSFSFCFSHFYRCRVSPMIREFVQSIDDREWQTQLFALLQKQTYNQVEVDLFELMCKVLDQNLFSQVDWARNTVFFKDLKVCDHTHTHTATNNQQPPASQPLTPLINHHKKQATKPQPVFKLGAKSATCYVKPTKNKKKKPSNNKRNTASRGRGSAATATATAMTAT